jgi:RHS repeat-associated protein
VRRGGNPPAPAFPWGKREKGAALRYSEIMPAATENTASTLFPLAAILPSSAIRPLAENSHQGLAPQTPSCIGPATSLSSTLHWASWQIYDGTASDRLVGLDYFGARYFSAAQGRFTSPDPLLNSGRPWNPQSWNRYAYTLNNPLKFTDPTGMYEWGACSGTQQECDNDRKQFRSALSNLKQARDSYDKKSREYKRLNAAFSAYGKEGEKNGVSVGFGALAGSTAGTTTPLGDMKSFAVTLDPSKWSKDVANAAKYLAGDVGHEGTHVDDLRQVFAGNALSDFSVEYRGYESSAFVFGALFKPALSANSGSSFGGEKSTNLLYGGSIIWNSSWGAADKAAIQSRDVGITNAVKSVYGHAETTPHNPWGN